MMKRKILHVVIASPEEVGRRCIDAWKKAESNEDFDERHEVSFCDLATYNSTLTPRRLRLLEYLKKNRSIAIEDILRFGGDTADINALAELGFVECVGDRIKMPWQEIVLP